MIFFFDFLVRWLLRNAGAPPKGKGREKGEGETFYLGERKESKRDS